MESLMRLLGYVPRDLYEGEKALRISAQSRSYEFYDKYLELKMSKGGSVG